MNTPSKVKVTLFYAGRLIASFACALMFALLIITAEGIPMIFTLASVGGGYCISDLWVLLSEEFEVDGVVL